MRARRIVLNAIAVFAALLLAGCYVTTQKLPATGGPVIDPQLIGTWQAFDEQGKAEGTYLHFIKTDEKTPLTFVMVDDHSWTVYEMTSLQVGKRQMFAVKQTVAPRGDKPEHNYIVGFYEIKGDDLSISLLDTKKVKELIAAHKIKGRVESGDYGKVTLTASPEELAALFATTDIDKLTGDKPAKAHRVSKPK